jgi:hypothetical protein
LAGRSGRRTVDWQWAARGPLTEKVSVVITDPDLPVVSGTRKLKAKCVWGLPDPGLTVTWVVGPSPAAVADAVASATVRSAVASAQRILPPRITSGRIMAHQRTTRRVTGRRHRVRGDGVSHFVHT